MYLRFEDKNESLALLLIDIDGFKDVNDTYSHKSGDRAQTNVTVIEELCTKAVSNFS